MLQLQARADLEAMEIMGYSAFFKLQHYLSFTIRLFSVIQDIRWGESYPYAEMQSVYSTAPTNKVRILSYKLAIGKNCCNFNKETNSNGAFHVPEVCKCDFRY